MKTSAGFFSYYTLLCEVEKIICLMRLIVFQKMVTSRWHRQYFSYDVELLISEEKIKYLSMNIPLDVLCSLGSLISHYMFTFKLFLTSLAKNLEAFSCASSIIWIFQRLGRRGLTRINLILEKSFAQSIRHPLNTGCDYFVNLFLYLLPKTNQKNVKC